MVGVPSTRFGQSIAAVVAPEAGRPLDPQDVISFVRSQIAGYKVPRHVLTVDAIPRGPNGKPDLPMIRDLALQRLQAEMA